MNRLLVFHISTLVALLVGLTACTTTPGEAPSEDIGDADFERATKTRTGSPPPVFKNVGVLKSQLGMDRRPSDLGYREKSFNPCEYGMSQECTDQYLTVINFQLLCRDSEGTVSSIPISPKPIVYPTISWSVGGQNGVTPTDRNGYGHLAVVSPRPLREKRLVLRKGPHYVGVSVSDINKLVLPRNWCGRG